MRWTHGGASILSIASRRLTIANRCRPPTRAVSAPTATPPRYPGREKTIGFCPSTPADRGGGPSAPWARVAPSLPRRRRARSGGPGWGSVVAAAWMLLPCAGSATQATAFAAGRPKPAGRPAIVTCSRSAWTTGAVERLRPSFPALRDGKGRLAAVIRRRAGLPRQLKQTSRAVLDTLGVLVPRAPEAPHPSW